MSSIPSFLCPDFLDDDADSRLESRREFGLDLLEGGGVKRFLLIWQGVSQGCCQENLSQSKQPRTFPRRFQPSLHQV